MLSVVFGAVLLAGMIAVNLSIDTTSITRLEPNLVFVALMLAFGGVGLVVVSLIENQPFWFGVAFTFWFGVGLNALSKAKKS